MTERNGSGEWLQHLVLVAVGVLISLCGYGLVQLSAHAERLTRVETKQETTDKLLQEVRDAMRQNTADHLEIKTTLNRLEASGSSNETRRNH